MIWPIVLSIFLSITHFYSKLFNPFVRKFHIETKSLSAGMLITLIFLYMIPEVTLIEPTIGKRIFLFILLGFVVFHLLEKYFYQHINNKKVLMKDLAELHVLGFFMEHFFIGVSLVLFSSLSHQFMGSLIFLPLLLITISSSLAMEQIHQLSKSLFNKVILSLSTTIGAVFATFMIISPSIYFIITSFAIGVLMYIVVRDMLPKGKAGNLIYFITGVAISILTLIIINKI